MKTKEEIIIDTIKEILKPFVYSKYGKEYIGDKESEGALRIEGFVLHTKHILHKLLSQQKREIVEEINKIYKKGITPKEVKKMGLPIMAGCLKDVQSINKKTK